jgi:hypothetical protein
MIMVGRYPNTLFHFTKTKLSLFGILEDNFHVSYAREKLRSSQRSIEFAAPMVSFCDLRLSEVSSHMEDYGYYGIGMSKKWAVDSGLNPVSYWNWNCRLINTYLRTIEDFFTHLQEISDLDEHLKMTRLYNDAMEVYRFIKNYEGDLIREGEPVKQNFRFANEREWRYVPPWEEPIRSFVPINEIRTPEDKARWNETLNGRKLMFTPDDINYLIVEYEEERGDLIQHIKRVKSKYTQESVIILASRILTSKQIIDDI